MSLKKDTICQYYQRGSCRYGKTCPSIHDSELRQIHNTKKYKTRLCKNILTKKSCQYEYKCNFGHSEDELIQQFLKSNEISNWKEYRERECQDGICRRGGSADGIPRNTNMIFRKIVVDFNEDPLNPWVDCICPDCGSQNGFYIL